MSYVLKERFRPPSEALYLTEPLRAMFELGTLHLYEPWAEFLARRRWSPGTGYSGIYGR